MFAEAERGDTSETPAARDKLNQRYTAVIPMTPKVKAQMNSLILTVKVTFQTQIQIKLGLVTVNVAH